MIDRVLDSVGVWLAWIYAVYGIAFLVIPLATFAALALLGLVVWAVITHARGGEVWTKVPPRLRAWIRLALEVAFGLINPVIYLAILTPSMPYLRADSAWWYAPLILGSWILLAVFWSMRLFGATLSAGSPWTRLGVRAVLFASLAWLLVFIVKDLQVALAADERSFPPLSVLVRVAPLYLIPAALLSDFILTTSRQRWPTGATRHSLFLLPDRVSRLVVVAVLTLIAATVALTLVRRSDATVRSLVGAHRESIQKAGDKYGVNPRLIAAIVYVTHRDQLSPFRNALERTAVSAWAQDQGDQYGGNMILLNQPLDISIGLAQIKPRTAQTASLFSTGQTPEDLPRPVTFTYKNGEPLGPAWVPLPVSQAMVPPFPVPAERQIVAEALLDPRTNLETCALILALYQHQWETANPDWALRHRPEILATLYQIGFARSKPHGAPRSNAFGTRVREVSEQRWIVELFPGAPQRL